MFYACVNELKIEVFIILKNNQNKTNCALFDKKNALSNLTYNG